MAKWLIPTLGYVVMLGALGVTSKLALRTAPWQALVVIVGVGYIFTSLVLIATGQAKTGWSVGLLWGALSAALAIGALILLYVALGSGEAGKVAPISAAYPAVTLLLAAAVLSEPLGAGRIAGVLLVIAGVIVLTVAR